jgi:carbon storage regulator
MLVLTRRIGEQIVIDGVISVTVVAIQGDKVRLGISAPPSVRVDRAEVHERRLASSPAVPRSSVSSSLEGIALMRTAQQGDRVQVQYPAHGADECRSCSANCKGEAGHPGHPEFT